MNSREMNTNYINRTTDPMNSAILCGIQNELICSSGGPVRLLRMGVGYRSASFQMSQRRR